jgi:crotonobetainyl-CoA:carnitine CoA-transferase CaiB-like acyl-CoA transferase
MSSLLIASGVLAALHDRQRTGMGQKVEVALIDSLVHALGNALGNYFINGWVVPRTGNRSPYFAPSGVYQCADGGLVFITCPTEKFFGALCSALDTGWAEDPRFTNASLRLQNEEALTSELDALCRTFPRDDLMAKFVQADVMASPVNTLPEIVRDPQVLYNDMITPVEHSTLGALKVTGVPVRLSRTPGAVRRAPPLLGQHSTEVLAELGYTDLEIAAMSKPEVTHQPRNA